jgi:hypothetical protein
MAIGGGDLDLLIRLRQAGHLDNARTVVEIGAQQLANRFFDDDRLKQVAEVFGIDLGAIATLGHPSPTGSNLLLAPDAPLARPFWEWLGFRYAAIDIDGSPGSIPLDLNYDSVPRRDRGRYDLVTNYGTTEHVANQLNAFKIIHELAAPGGVMVHNLPAQGFCGHGLVNYNMKFFWMLSLSNDYQWLYADYAGGERRHELPQDLVDWVARYRPNFTERSAAVQVAEAGIIVALKKTRDIPYVAPLDASPGARAANPILARRYWTVFGEAQPRPWWRRLAARLSRPG